MGLEERARPGARGPPSHPRATTAAVPHHGSTFPMETWKPDFPEAVLNGTVSETGLQGAARGGRLASGPWRAGPSLTPGWSRRTPLGTERRGRRGRPQEETPQMIFITKTTRETLLVTLSKTESI